MASHLTDMEIDEISLVDDGANPGARVEIWKSKKGPKMGEHSEPDGDEDGEDKDGDGDGLPPNKAAGDGRKVAKAAEQLEFDMNLEELSAALEQAEARLDTLEKAKTAAETKAAELDAVVKAKDARIAELEGTIAKRADPAAADEAFLKSLPEAARDAILKARQDAADAKVELAKARDATETAEAITKAKALGVGKPEDVGPLLMRVAKGKTTQDDAKALEQLLKSAGAVSAKSLLFKALGADSAVDGDPEALLKAKADEIRKGNPKLTPEAAYSAALDENPGLYAASIAKRRMAAAGVAA